jgi:epoxyqueuosine reductase
MPSEEKSAAHISNEIKKFAAETGFDSVRFTAADGIKSSADYFKEFIDKEYHGDMAWMEEKAERRSSPKALWPDVKSVIMLGMNYGPDQNPMAILDHKELAAISVYAKGKDYHNILKKKLKQLARWIVQEYGVEVKVFVDTAPVMEKPLAHKSGLGWQGKHTNLVSKEYGSWLFLGSIFTTLELPEDKPLTVGCGSCTSCLDICPTKAFPNPYQLDARRCISYLTIEYKGHIAEEFRKPMGNRIYGCDDCLSVCPWNKFASLTNEINYLPRVELDYPHLSDLASMNDKSFRNVFSGSPIKRIGRDYFIRNIMIAMGNSEKPEFIPQLTEKLSEASPHIRAMAVWALSQLLDRETFIQLRSPPLALETDEDVRAEWAKVF